MRLCEIYVYRWMISADKKQEDKKRHLLKEINRCLFCSNFAESEKNFDHFTNMTRYYRYKTGYKNRKGDGNVPDDDELVEQIRLGNEGAAEELIKRYYGPVLRYCKRHCPSLEKAEDITQDTFLKLFKNLSAYERKRKFKAYLYTIANHLCIDESRKVPLYTLENEENIVNEHNEISRLENQIEVNDLLNMLSPEQREAIILRFGEQLEFKEIAKVMGCNMRTAQSRVRNALRIMRKVWRNER